jgi:hypothetical protein
MMRGLFGDIVSTSIVWIVPIASESLAEDGIQGLLHTADPTSVNMLEAQGEWSVRWFDVPATQVEFDDRNKTLQRVSDGRHGQ